MNFSWPLPHHCLQNNNKMRLSSFKPYAVVARWRWFCIPHARRATQLFFLAQRASVLHPIHIPPYPLPPVASRVNLIPECFRYAPNTHNRRVGALRWQKCARHRGPISRLPNRCDWHLRPARRRRSEGLLESYTMPTNVSVNRQGRCEHGPTCGGELEKACEATQNRHPSLLAVISPPVARRGAERGCGRVVVVACLIFRCVVQAFGICGRCVIETLQMGQK